jgi:phenylacetate-CoA ligase
MLRRSLLPKYLEIRSKGFLKELNRLLESQYYSETDLINLQEEKMQKLIRFAYENVPYYKEKFDEYHLTPSDLCRLTDLQKLPVLTKQEMNNNIHKLVPRQQRPNVFVRRTSGSTGTPYKIITDSKSALVESAIFYRFLLSIGYEWGDQIISLWGAPIVKPDKGRVFKSIKEVMSSKLWNKIYFDTYSLDRSTIRKILLLLSKNTPQILRGYVSSVYLIALEAIKAEIKCNLKGVTTTAEKLFDYQREVIEKAFGQKIYDQYGCGESNSIAFECENHNGLHVASEHVILEILNDNNEFVSDETSGRVIITDLDNYAMPLIRYENNDLARWSKDICSCGRNLPLLQHIEGRAYEILNVPNGKKIHGGFFDEIYIEMKFGDKYLIDDLRVVQEDLYNYRLEFVMQREFNEEDISVLKEKYRQYLGDVNVKITYVESIPPTKTGKRMFIIPYHYNNPAKESDF